AADIHGLGASLFWLVSGQTPYPREANVADALRHLQTAEPQRLSKVMRNVPAALDDLIAQMLDRNPDRRPESARAVMHALARFASAETAFSNLDVLDSRVNLLPGDSGATVTRHVLILDDEPAVRKLARAVIEPMGCTCYEAGDGLTAMDLINDHPIDLILLGMMLPEVNCSDLCTALA